MIQSQHSSSAPIQKNIFATFVFAEFHALLRSRKMMLISAIFLYPILVMPFILQKPPEDFIKIVSAWFGEERALQKLYLFMWVDLAMNKYYAVFAPVLASAILVHEKSVGSIDLFLSKPITPTIYFLGKLIAATIAFMGLCLLGSILAAIYFSFMVPDFPATLFVILTITQLFLAGFCVVFSAAIAQCFRHRLTALLASILFLFCMVGFAFIGFYNPAYQTVAYANPFYYGVWIFGHLHHLTFWHLLLPIVVLILYSAIFVGLGVWRVARMEARDELV